MSDTATPAPVSRDLDFTRAFTFFFKDPDWLPKTLLGGLFVALSALLVGLFFVLGWMARLARNVVAGRDVPLPEWDDLGGMFAEGLKLFVVTVAYSLPVWLVYLAIILVMVVSGAAGGDTGGIAAAASGCAMLAVVPFAILFLFLLPIALVNAAVTGAISSAFDLAEIFRIIRRNFINYLLAIVVYFVANFLAQFGIALLCIGILFTTFIQYAIATWAFAECWRLDRQQI